MLQAAPAETKRFGLHTARATLPLDFDPAALRAAIVEAQLDLVILRISGSAGSPAARIEQVGFSPLHTDTLVTYSCRLDKLPVIPAPSTGVETGMATASDAEQIEALVRDIFATYPNHYTANPALSPALALDGYVEWALSHLHDADKYCFVARIDGRFAGFAATRHDPSSKIATGVLFGVSSAFAGRGLYTDFVRLTLAHYQAAGYVEMRNATQVGNLAVQRVWLREHFKLEQTDHTWHLLPLLASTLAQTPRAVEIGGAGAASLMLENAAEGAIAHVQLGTDAKKVRTGLLYQSERRFGNGVNCTTRLLLNEQRKLIGWSQIRQ